MLKQTAGPLFTDLYELTMAAGYFHHGQFADATFSLFIRSHPSQRNYYVTAGLEDILDELKDFHFSKKDIQYLNNTKLFSDDFLSYLENLRFSGTIHALPEGTIFFPDEPILEITAPVIEAQLLETLILNTIGFQTIIATKASRCIHAAGERALIDFSLRRTQGQHAGIKVARCTYIAGFAGTSNVLAGNLYDIPISGTMAHSFVTAFDNELAAFSAYSRTFPQNTVLLIDTYDTVQGAKNAVKVAMEMKKQGASLVGVRLDSGDMAELSKKVRYIFDEAGLPEVKIFASSGFDEYKISDILSQGAKIDAFGVGTKVGVSADAPYVDIVYKMVTFDNRNVKKLSPGKQMLTGKKQIFRKTNAQGMYIEDTIGLRDDSVKNTEPLLQKVIDKGSQVNNTPSLEEIRDRFKHNFSYLPDKYKHIDVTHAYPVKLTPRLKALQADP